MKYICPTCHKEATFIELFRFEKIHIVWCTYCGMLMWEKLIDADANKWECYKSQIPQKEFSSQEEK